MISKLSIPKVFHVLFYREEDAWLAHCLDLDLIEQGETIEEAMRHVTRVTRKHLEYAIETQNDSELFHPAPQEFWDRLANAKPLGSTGNIRIRPKRHHAKGLPKVVPALAYKLAGREKRLSR